MMDEEQRIITAKSKVYLDGISYYRLEFDDSNVFEDIECHRYYEYLDTLGYVERLKK